MNTQNNTPASRNEEARSLHDQIMNIPAVPPVDANPNQRLSYKVGHRDARHAAAELALAAAGAAIDAGGQELGALIFKLECFIDHATGGKLSKSSWALETLKAAHDEYLNSFVDEALAERLAASRPEAPPASASPATVAQPMFFASPEQAHALEDRPGDTEHGLYLPVRKTAAGKFTMPLYTAPSEALSPATVAQPVEWLPTPTNVNALPGPVRDYIHDLVTNCDPSNMVRENAMLRDTNAGLQKMYRAAADALAEVRGCFEMAESEGLSIALAETADERLKDLVERRLMHASYAAQPCASQGCGGAAVLTDEQLDAALPADVQRSARGHQKRWRAYARTVLALSTAKSGEHGATDGGTGE